MKGIILTQGKVALIKDEWYQEVNKYSWSARKLKHQNTYYALRNSLKSEHGERKNKYIIFMHNYIWELMGNIIPEGMFIDHVDRDGLNNQDDNLRLATRSQNKANSKIYKNNPSGYIGVYKLGPYQYRAIIRYNTVNQNLGIFTTAEMAARTRDYHAIKYFGEFANLNFPESRELYKF